MKISNGVKFSHKKIYVLALFLSFLFMANFCSAAFLKPGTQNEVEKEAGNSANFGGYKVSGNNIYGLIQVVVNAFLAVIGVLLLIYMLYAGYNWMTAQGEEEKVEKAKDTLKRAVVGTIIIVAAYAISYFVMGRLQQGTLRNGTGGGIPPPAQE
ncbi:MAG: hypothetical protein HYV53_03020 [Parcubacteria group bacterium]|nr:hypothetical protein [Parcubacteria group bacterium]